VSRPYSCDPEVVTRRTSPFRSEGGKVRKQRGLGVFHWIGEGRQSTQLSRRRSGEAITGLRAGVAVQVTRFERRLWSEADGLGGVYFLSLAGRAGDGGRQTLVFHAAPAKKPGKL
jgi:hypothetical protein